ncbi:hypothetical protein DY000_02048624 [Brassica cretica]|uniref:OCRE domain-containing protein n=1 Tax=Brassica cretica TaxID=69181 RepID=A0ABQ7EZ80_BRACR|nr:hypothetical protein DY000_02048624 [Brassica cretica]
MSSRRINDPGIIAACHFGVEYETEYSASIETHTVTSIDSGNQKSTDNPHDESVDSLPDDWENDYYNPTIAAYTRQNMHTEEYDVDYEDERATEYKAILHEEDTLLHHSSWKRNAPSIDIPGSPSSIDRHHQLLIDRRRSQQSREGDYSIGSWADDHHHKSYAVETTIYEPGADELQEEYQQKDTKEFYDAAGGIDKSFKLKSRHPIRPSIDVDVSTSVDRQPEFGRRAFDFHGTRRFYWEEKDQYGVYRDDQGCA